MENDIRIKLIDADMEVSFIIPKIMTFDEANVFLEKIKRSIKILDSDNYQSHSNILYPGNTGRRPRKPNFLETVEECKQFLSDHNAFTGKELVNKYNLHNHKIIFYYCKKAKKYLLNKGIDPNKFPTKKPINNYSRAKFKTNDEIKKFITDCNSLNKDELLTKYKFNSLKALYDAKFTYKYKHDIILKNEKLLENTK